MTLVEPLSYLTVAHSPSNPNPRSDPHDGEKLLQSGAEDASGDQVKPTICFDTTSVDNSIIGLDGDGDNGINYLYRK